MRSKPVDAEVTVFTYDELSPKAQERAREWWLEGYDFDHEMTFEDVRTQAMGLGINIEHIFFSGFCSQGNGACFQGRWDAPDCKPDGVIENCPTDDRLHQVALAFKHIIEEWPHAYFEVTQRGRYMHKHSTDFAVGMGLHISEIAALKLDGQEPTDLDPDQPSDHGECEDTTQFLIETARDFMDWIYHQLEAEYEHQTSEEYVADTLRDNGFTFTAEGERCG